MAPKGKNLVFRPVVADDIGAILQLFERNNYELPSFRTPEFIRWQYFDGPRGPAIMYGAFDEHTLAGLYNLTLSRLLVGGRETTGALTLGTLTDAGYRSVIYRENGVLSSIFTKLARMTYQDAFARKVKLIYGFPNSSSYPGFVQHLGFKDIGTLTFFARPGDLRGLPRLVLPLPKSLDFLAASAGQCFAAALRPSVDWDADVTIQVMEKPDLQLDDLVAPASRIHPIIQVRDARYVQWRYFNHPLIRYEVLGAYRRGRLLGYLVWAVLERAGHSKNKLMRMGHVVDCSCPPDAQGRCVLDQLILTADRKMRQQGAMVNVAVSTPVPYVARAFQRAGFLSFAGRLTPRKFPLIVRTDESLPAGADIAGTMDNWYITFSDNDVI